MSTIRAEAAKQVASSIADKYVTKRGVPKGAVDIEFAQAVEKLSRWEALELAGRALAGLTGSKTYREKNRRDAEDALRELMRRLRLK
jgi:hypothetical protein